MLLRKERANIKQSVASIALVANAFIWYLIAFYSLKISLTQQGASSADTLLILGVNAAAIAIAGLIGTFVVGKFVERRHFLYIWLASGIVLSLIPLGINIASLTQIMILSIIFGAYFGLGMPATMSYHSSLTKVENRAKMGGITFFIIGVTTVSSLIIQSSILEISLFLAAVRIIGLITLYAIKVNPQKQTKSTIETKVTYRSILTNKSFILYFIPWLMFTLINYTTIPIQEAIYPSQATYAFLTDTENIIIAVAAVVSGFVADKMGRKRLSIIGFILLGIGYAVLGLAATSQLDSANLASSQNLLIGRIIFMITDGVAWGIFYVLFIFTIWGDLANHRHSDKFYYIGVLPYVSAYLMQLVLTPYLSEIDIRTIFSFASVFLFLAILPLIYAPETLPEKVMKDNELKSYIEKAKKKAEKGEQKKQDNQEPTEPVESNNNYEEAKVLAEKYY